MKYAHRKFTTDELEIFYCLIGECIWHIQYLEDVLHTFLTLKIEIRTPGRVPVEEASELLAKHRRATLGTALKIAEKHIVLPLELLAKLRDIKYDSTAD